MGLVEIFIGGAIIGFLQDGNPLTLCISGCGIFG